MPDKKIIKSRIYTISYNHLQELLSKIPTLQDNKKSPEYLLSAQTKDDIITTDEVSPSVEDATFINIKFSYDFVMNRWFLTDKRIEVIESAAV